MNKPNTPDLNVTGIVNTPLGGKTPPRSWTCRVISGDDAGRSLSVGGRPVIIGADQGCDLVLSDPAVSRRHAEIKMCESGMMIRDLGSTNGTFYQSSRIKEVILPAEAIIRVGNTKLQITAISPPTVQPSGRTRFGGLVGESRVMREVFAVLELASPSEATVMIEGESGTGKELAARAIHDHSKRADKPFVVVDCSATQEHLIDSQLFGHLRGAFTGAVSSRKGAFVEANGGTLFLDEIGEMPLASQGKLLRALEAHTVQPLGSDQVIRSDARVIAATHRDLGALVRQNTFRFDLFQRLAVVHVRLPSLRERIEDLPLLVKNFYEGRAAEPGPISGSNLERLQSCEWNGNVRELRNLLERSWVLCGSASTRFEDLRLNLDPPQAAQPIGCVDHTLPFKEAKERWIEQFESRYLAAVIAACGNNISKAAAQSGINRNHLRKLLERYGLLLR